MSGTPSDLVARARAAERILAEHGIDAVVTAAGRDGEVAGVSCEPTRLGELAQHVAALRALGFRFVAVDIAPTAGSGLARP